ncbi:E3 ubiquitin-protein ligase RNF10-like isoform X2 [Convolutriloba macropyga]|uniref:E3 ubiquitin-protein ligase RNF10-like isoform X2 n=1 Tax=Convolutriloba macropyga TaxID=536237 RepID=UPI003F51B94B
MKKSSRKVPMSTPSKSGGGIDSHSSSSNSSCGTVGTLSSGGGGSAALPSSGPATKDLGGRKPKNYTRNNGSHVTKTNYKQHLYKTGGNDNSSSLSTPIGRSRRTAANGPEVLIDEETELNNEIEGLRISRKTNLSHLLNFKYSNSAHEYADDYYYSGGGGGYMAFVPHSRGVYKKSYDKYQFIQANCKFVVDESCEDIISPDTFIDWEGVVEVQLLTPDFSYCAICLEKPTAPKITKCGHVYCYSCVLQLLCLSEKKWAKCPICFDAVSEKDLRCVKSLNKKLFKIGDSITLCLMTRLRNSIKVTPKVAQLTSVGDGVIDKETEGVKANSSVSTSAVDLDKVTKLDIEQQIQLVYQPVMDCLETRAKDETNEADEVKFIDMAISKTKQTIVDLRSKLEKQRNPSTEIEDEEEVPLNPLPPSKASSKWANNSVTTCGTGAAIGICEKYLFYQSEDGQMIFANAFTAKCLLKEYGSLENCPVSISGQIVDLCEVRVDESFRNSYRFLAHLPLATVVTFAELDLRPPVLSRQTLKYFADEIRVRKEEKDKKRKEERKRERRINREMERKLYPGCYPSQVSFEQGDDEDDFNMIEQLKASEENFPSVSLASGVPEDENSEEIVGNQSEKQQRTTGVISKKNMMKPRQSVMDTWESSEPVEIYEDTSLSGAQFTSFADVLLTTCASPPSGATPGRSSTSGPSGAWAVGGGRKGSVTSWSNESSQGSQMTYAQRMEAMEQESDHREALLFAVDGAGIDVVAGADIHNLSEAGPELLAPPSHNDAFSMAFQQALFKQAGKDKGKKKRKGSSNNNSSNNFN